MGNGCGFTKRVFRVWRIPQIAFEIGDRGGLNEGFVNVIGIQQLAGAEIGIHRAFAIGCNEDETTRGGGAFN